ncbi:MAG: UvrD-helicase domain-containing protein [Phycisphaerales bacterium]
MSLMEEHAPHSTDGMSPASTEADPLLADLTGPQRDAVMHTEGPVLVVAAAGSGKTRTITRRMAYLVRCGIPPWSIMALTFTNKAAAEMRSRVMELLNADPRATRGLTVTTFHSLCARLLRRYADLAGLPGLKADFTIYDSADQASLVKRVLESAQLSASNWPPRTVLSAISAAKNELRDAGAYAAQAGDFYSKTIARVYAGYEKALRAANAVDFDDLLLLTARMLKENAAVRGECQRRWQYLLIDEYQDTNRAQFVIASLLAGTGDGRRPPNICVVGDPDQSIYAWRGADISNILDFERQYPGARVITLGENFRSTAPILSVADTLIRNNKQRKHKDLFTRRPGGERVQIVLCQNEQHEATLIVDRFKALHSGVEERGEDAPEGGLPWREMAVFYRTNALSRVMEDAFRAAGIPYVIARGTAFFEREEIKNALAYLRVVANPADEVSLLRIINTPARGLGDSTINAVEVYAAHAGVPFFEALRQAPRIVGISARARGSIQRFVETVDGWTAGGSFMGEGVSASLADLVERVIKESGLEKMYQAQAKAARSETDAERLDNLDELVSSARQFELEYDPTGDPANDVEPAGAGVPPGGAPPPLLSLLRAYLESVSLVADADAVDPSQGAVTLMTLHAAKGLEFGAVAMIGLEEGLLPHSRARESDAALEEERRLCFVGITRAMRHLQITSAKYRTHRGLMERTIPSRFLGELGRQHVIVSDQSDALADLEETEWGSRPAGPDRALPARAASPLSVKFPIGSLVRHPQFGVGKVLSITPGANARAQINFRDVGTKTLVLSMTRLERIGG